jgi:very-short-patch-repair endonuclease
MEPKYKVRTITCEHCQTTLTARMPAGRHFCSLACYRSSLRPRRKTGKDVTCTLCGVAFYVPLARAKRQKVYFCCNEHHNEWQGRNKTKHKCKICGSNFQWSPSRVKANNVTYCSLICRNADPARREMLIKMTAKQQQLNPNKIETIGYSILSDLAIPYEPQSVIAGKFCVDALLPQLKTIIQFDGDYWHGNPSKFPELDARQTRRSKLDKSQDAYLRKCGYTIIRIWETDLLKHRQSVVSKLRKLLTQP